MTAEIVLEVFKALENEEKNRFIKLITAHNTKNYETSLLDSNTIILLARNLPSIYQQIMANKKS